MYDIADLPRIVNEHERDIIDLYDKIEELENMIEQLNLKVFNPINLKKFEG